MREIEISDKRTVEEATEEALRLLGITKENAIIEVLAQGGLFSKPRVKVTERATSNASANAIEEGNEDAESSNYASESEGWLPLEGGVAFEFCSGLLKAMGFEVQITQTKKAEEIMLELVGEDMGGVIGYRGEVLDAVQYLTSVVANQGNGRDKYTRITVNTEGYRQRRGDTLNALADRMADKAVATGRRVPLEAMNPCDRRTIHVRLQDNPEVTAHSEGEEPNRRIIIVPKGEKRFGGRDSGGNAKNGRGRNDRNNRNGNNNGRGRNGGRFDRRGDKPAGSGFSESYFNTPASGFSESFSTGKNYTTSKKYNK